MSFITINVQCNVNSDQVVVNKKQPVKFLKMSIANTFGLRPTKFDLEFEGNELETRTRVEQCLREGDTVIVHMR